jgi:hypothetical protein
MGCLGLLSRLCRDEVRVVEMIWEFRLGVVKRSNEDLQFLRFNRLTRAGVYF